MSLAPIASHIPTNQPAPIMSQDANPHASTSEGLSRDNTTPNAFDDYTPPPATISSRPNLDTDNEVGDRLVASLRDDPTINRLVALLSDSRTDSRTVSAKAALERIIEKWETDGVDRECIATARRLLASEGDPITDLSSVNLLKLKEELEKTGEWVSLRQQAIEAICNGESWKTFLGSLLGIRKDSVGECPDWLKRGMKRLLFLDSEDSTQNAHTVHTVISINLQKEHNKTLTTRGLIPPETVYTKV